MSETFATPSRTALTVMYSGSEPVLSPFFGKCDGLLILDGTSGTTEFHPNEFRTAEALSKLIMAVKPDRLVCSYIGAPEKEQLRAAGIDVRLGTCTCTVGELSAGFNELPWA